MLTFGKNGWRVYQKVLYYFCTDFGSLRSFQYEKLKKKCFFVISLIQQNVRTPSWHRRPNAGGSAEPSGPSSHNLQLEVASICLTIGSPYLQVLNLHIWIADWTVSFSVRDLSTHRFWYLQVLEPFPHRIPRDDCASFMPGFSFWPEFPPHHYNEANLYSFIRPQIIFLLPQKILPGHSRQS